MKILIAEDDPVSRIKLKKILEPYGQIVAVDSGTGAVAAFKQAWGESLPFDLICLDVSMPGLDGTEVLFEIRETELEMNVTREKPVKVMMITAHADKDTIITAIQAGCDDYLVKPFDREKVLSKIRRIGFQLEKQ